MHYVKCEEKAGNTQSKLEPLGLSRKNVIFTVPLSKGALRSKSLSKARFDKNFEDEEVLRIQRVTDTNSVMHLSASLQLSGWSAYLEQFSDKDTT